MSLEMEFTEALEGTITAAKKRRYVPAYFMQMLAEHRGVKPPNAYLQSPSRKLDCLSCGD